ncbi:MAG: hypothetical protein ACK45B_06770 [Limisphaerales bacterium]
MIWFRRFPWLAVLLALALSPKPALAASINVAGGTVYQVIDGIGANVNFRSWEGTNLVPVFDAMMDQAGFSLFRVVHDLSDWEAQNDDADPLTMNWDYFNSVYGSSTNEFPKLWGLMEFLNSRGYTDRAFLAFMGWGPDWMMDSNVVVLGKLPQLRAGMEAEWAETIASALIYARHTRGLQFSLVSPNNESDINFEGVRMDMPRLGTNATQYIVAMRKLVELLDAHGMTNLAFVGPDRSKAPDNVGYESIPAMMADPAISNRMAHFGIHSYVDGGGYTPDVVAYVNANNFGPRRVWLTEFNRWCDTCDFGVAGNYGWTDSAKTAEHLLWHLQTGASAAMVYEGYDSIYRHHNDGGNPPQWTVWGFWGLFGVDNTNAPVLTYSPRKNFYTMAQISRWVRPGARRVGVGGSFGSLWPLSVYKHDALGQVTIVGRNTGSTTTLSGTLANVPAVTGLELYYTTANTNLAFGGSVPVSGGAFPAITIPGDSVFTLTGFTAKKLTNGIARAGSLPAGSALDHYRYDVTNANGRLQFEVLAPSQDVALFVGKTVPSDGQTLVDYQSDQPGTVGEMVLVRPGDLPKPLAAGPWFLSVQNRSGLPVSYEVRVTKWEPLELRGIALANGQVCVTWNSIPGATYVVQSQLAAAGANWTDASVPLTATSTNESLCLPLPGSTAFFRVLEGPTP